MPDNGAASVNHHPHDPGFRHIALRVRDFDAAYAELQEHHSAGRILALMPAAAAAGGGQIAFFSDLEGNLVQIVSRPEELL
jgi:catechol 2,3-dioxygenase-like lactoylglutathione lyase family enzyme